MSLATMVYSLLPAPHRTTHRTCSKDYPSHSVPVRLLQKQKKIPGTGRGAGCCIEGGYTPSLGYLHTDTLGVASSPADRRKGPNATKTMKLLPESNRPVKYYDTTP